ncbi:hypothetical protein NP233_g8508 [Leucocoprinus birnbaumii]|uniref:Nuclear transport factor 2 n=1 Tax=Leucocoprinus birnbaumii TaxID=56174 RepID=A0AAD5VM83_9AGAR|nr:hypothetical protein NP233_g8508 [Leucocoprinus birnbaumii]
MDPKAVAIQFRDFYYGIFDTNRSQLQPLYRPSSMLTWEGQEFLGTESILEKLTALPFEKIRREITTTDVQPCGDDGILIFITGALIIDDGQPIQFSQTFRLKQESGSFVVANDIFRLNLG